MGSKGSALGGVQGQSPWWGAGQSPDLARPNDLPARSAEPEPPLLSRGSTRQAGPTSPAYRPTQKPQRTEVMAFRFCAQACSSEPRADRAVLAVADGGDPARRRRPWRRGSRARRWRGAGRARGCIPRCRARRSCRRSARCSARTWQARRPGGRASPVPSGFRVARSKSKNTRSPTLSTRSSWLPGAGPAVATVVPEPALAVVSGFAQAASSATAAKAPSMEMFIGGASLVEVRSE